MPHKEAEVAVSPVLYPFYPQRFFSGRGRKEKILSISGFLLYKSLGWLFSTGKDFALQGTFGNWGKTFGCGNGAGGGHYWRI